MEKDPKIFLEHILESIDIVDSYISELTFEKFLDSDNQLKDAVVRRLEIIGEATRNLPKNFIEKHKEINWKEAVGMRDKIVHEYFDVDWKIVWDTVLNDLPKFKKQISELLENWKG